MQLISKIKLKLLKSRVLSKNSEIQNHSVIQVLSLQLWFLVFRFNSEFLEKSQTFQIFCLMSQFLNKKNLKWFFYAAAKLKHL